MQVAALVAAVLAAAALSAGLPALPGAGGEEGEARPDGPQPPPPPPPPPPGGHSRAQLGEPVVNDTADPAPTVDYSPKGPFAVGSHKINWTADDKNDNTADATQNLTITDTTPPVIRPPLPIKYDCPPTARTPVTIGAGTAHDLVDGDIVPTVVPTSVTSIDTHTITWTATDQRGNTATVKKDIPFVDTAPPRFTHLPSATVEAEGPTTTLTTANIGAVTAIGRNNTVLVPTFSPTSVSGLGTHTITWTATDRCGITVSAKQQVVVQDTTPPLIRAPPDKSIEATGMLTPVTRAQLGEPVVNDTADPAPAVDYSPKGPFAVGSHKINWTATDFSSNSASATQTLTITDRTDPTIEAPSDKSIEATGRLTPVTRAQLGEPVAVNDIADPASAVDYSPKGPFSVGLHTITWKATDKSGNDGTDPQTLTVRDTTPPDIRPPLPIKYDCPPTARTPVTIGAGTAHDLVDGDIVPTVVPTSVTSIDTHTITWTAADQRGNTATVKKDIPFVDTAPPRFTHLPSATVEAEGPTTTLTTANIGAVTAIGRNNTVLVPTFSPTSVSGLGTHTITWTATDRCGITVSAKQQVVVQDTTPPSIRAPPNIRVDAGPTRCMDIDLGDYAVSDAVDPSPSVTPSQPGPYCVGTTSVRWNATDFSGNSRYAWQRVTVNPTTPTITVLHNTTIRADGSFATIPEVEFDAVSATDPHDPSPAISYSPKWLRSGSAHTVTWTATNTYGRSASATSTVWVTPDKTCEVELARAVLDYGYILPNTISRQAVQEVFNTGTLPITSIYLNSTDWTSPTSSAVLPASVGKFRVLDGGRPSEWTGLSSTAVPPTVIRPHRSFEIAFRLDLTGYSSLEPTLSQTTDYEPSCALLGSSGVLGQSSEPPVVAGTSKQSVSTVVIGQAAAAGAPPAAPAAGAPPAAPVAGLRIVRNYSDAIAVQWDGQPGAAAGYKAVLIPDGDVGRRFAAVTQAAAFTFVNLDADTPHEIRIGVRGDDWTQASAAARTLPAGALPFDTGLALNATLQANASSILLEWADGNGMGGDRYRVERLVAGGAAGGNASAQYGLADLGPRHSRAIADAVLEEWSGAVVHYRVFEWLDSQKLYSNEAEVRVP